jgi:DNA-binding CsgD family transcriptional regulator/PAS domain-containing protein
MSPEKEIRSLIRSVYEAAADPARWPEFLHGFARAVRSPAVAFLVQDLRNTRGSTSAAIGFDPLWERRYAEYYGRINVWVERASHRLPPGIVSRTQEIISDEELVKTEFYNDFLRPQDHFYAFGSTLAQEETIASYITAMRSKADGPFDSGEAQLLQELTPHLQTALRIHSRLSSFENRLHGLTDALNNMAQGVMLVDAIGRISFMNRYAEEIVRVGAGLKSVNGIVCAVHPDQTEKLHGLIALAAGKVAGRLAGQIMTLSRSAFGRDLSLMVAPLTSSHPAAAGHSAAIVFVTDPDRTAGRKARDLEHLLELTAAESRLAKALAEGKTIAEFAGEAGVSLNTVRSQLKQIFSKTGVSRQSDLVRLVLTVSPQVAGPSTRASGESSGCNR